MKRLTLRELAALAAVIGMVGCASRTLTYQPAELAGLKNPSIHVLADRSQEAPVTGTFGWGYCLFRVAQNPSNQLAAVGERLQRAASASLTAKGLSFAEAEPDLLVSYALAADAAIDETELDRAYHGLLKEAVSASDASVHYKRGVLVLDVVARRTGRLLWRGAIMAEIDLAWPEERKQERCDAVISELLRHYPKP